MNQWQKRILTSCLSILLITLAAVPLRADTLDDLQKQINDLQTNISVAQKQEKTLSQQITLINNEISLTKLRIQSTEEKLTRLTTDINTVTDKIVRIQDSLNQVSNILVNRIVQTYVTGRTDPVLYLLSASDFNGFLERFEYLRIVQKHDKTLMIQMATTKQNYHDQKDLLVEKKTQVEALSAQLKAYQTDLDQQNQEKQSLLAVTQNNEKRYQDLLAQAEAELSAIKNSQFSGKRHVNRGEVIGLMGSTGFSTGPHLHFGVYNLSEDQAASFNYNDNTNNPLDYLSRRNIYVDSGACYDKSGNTDVGNGSWSWPLSNPYISQCYGKTPYSFVYANGLHMGLDIVDNNDVAVRAVDDGEAYFYRGSSSFGNNVRIFQGGGKMTLYLHLQ